MKEQVRRMEVTRLAKSVIAATACWALAGPGALSVDAPDAADASGEPGASSPLNVLFILIDDLGWKDLGCYGGEVFKTPNIDRLAREGMRFSDAYAACSVCSPTRASLMTGKYPGRLHFTAFVNHQRRFGNVAQNPARIKLVQPGVYDGIQPSEFTLPNAFRDAGYRTALFGKTHFQSSKMTLTELGFDVFQAPECDMGPTPPAVVESDPKRMTTITDRSLDFMRDCARQDKPFFLYVPHNAVHVQVQTTQPYLDKHTRLLSEKDKEKYSTHYVAMVEELDNEIGRLLAELDKRDLARNTVVVLTSDNGGNGSVTSMEPLRGGKGGQYEGGHRVPLIVRWPGSAKPGTVSGEPVITPDFYPTCLELAGLPEPERQQLDGVSFVPALRGDSLDREAIYWHKPHYYAAMSPMSSVRCGRYKYIMYWETELSPHGGPANELFDLEADIGETRNLLEQEPEVVARLHAMLMAHVRETDCKLPTVNPRFEPEPEKE